MAARIFVLIVLGALFTDGTPGHTHNTRVVLSLQRKQSTSHHWFLQNIGISRQAVYRDNVFINKSVQFCSLFRGNCRIALNRLQNDIFG